MARHREAQAFLGSLPVAGVDGTLRRRFEDSVAAGNVRAKTGSLHWAAAISGYMTNAAGEHLAFSVMLNRFAVETLILGKCSVPGGPPAAQPQAEAQTAAAPDATPGTTNAAAQGRGGRRGGRGGGAGRMLQFFSVEIRASARGGSPRKKGKADSPPGMVCDLAEANAFCEG